MARGLSICKRIISNPIFVALLLTVIVIIIIVAIYRVQNFGGAELFKCGFYIFAIFLIIIFIHDFLIKKSMKATHINKDVKEVFTGIDLSKEMSHEVIQVEPISYDTFKNNNNGYGYIQGDNYIRGGSNNDNYIQGGNSNNDNDNNDNNGNDDNNGNSNGNDNNDNNQKNNDDGSIISSISANSVGSKNNSNSINNILNSIVPIDIKTTNVVDATNVVNAIT